MRGILSGTVFFADRRARPKKLGGFCTLKAMDGSAPSLLSGTFFVAGILTDGRRYGDRCDRATCVCLPRHAFRPFVVCSCWVSLSFLFFVLLLFRSLCALVDHVGRMLRARQLTKLLLNAPLLSLSRLHVTALMSQAHIVDGMVNYVEMVQQPRSNFLIFFPLSCVVARTHTRAFATPPPPPIQKQKKQGGE